MSKFKEVKPKGNIMKGAVACPNCESKNTSASNEIGMKIGVGLLICFLSMCISTVIPFIGLIAFPLFGIGTVLFFIAFLIVAFGGKYTLSCHECGKKYKIGKIEYTMMAKNKIRD
ncbi:hypothetical protein [Romboutsia sp. 1001285H_161024_C4]|uniref:hypothetical protein n=1 Tax=Romboutsia sp. 1001285H_161024_C4 TaxID=2787109 RepID=UPI0018973DA4|nr:hypothetical protein [Romboutsia sp. 1001285H_161024_C4]